ncbi:MAG: hypothetical protein ABR543_00675 [Gemmatimonadaceae bacterium]
MRARSEQILALMCALTTAVSAQEAVGPGREGGGGSRCLFEFENRPTTAVSSMRQPSGEYNSFVSGGVVAHCRSQQITLVADSLEYYGDSRLLYLIGAVHYTEPRLDLRSQRLTYWMTEERLHAEGDVDATLPNGTKLLGPSTEYYRAVPALRPRARMIAPGRPTITVVQRDSAGSVSEPMTVVANTVVMEGDSLVFASGRVEITRTDVIARSDSAALDNGREWARLVGRPVIEGKGDRAFTLSGSMIDLFARSRLLERVFTVGSAKVVSEDVTLTSDSLDMRLADRVLQSAQAWGSSRARAFSPRYDIVADSLDVRMPGQRLKEVHAVRDAHAQSVPDTLKVRTTERDWLRGDTVVAYFDSVATDTIAKQPDINRLDALGSARSYYQMAPRDSTAAAPAINYVRGRNITIAFVSQTVDRVTVVDEASGVFVEPTPVGVVRPTPQRTPAARPTRDASITQPARSPP